MAQGFNYGPGQNLTRNNRFAQMLMQQEQNAPPITAHSQGLASMFRQGLAGYMQGKDMNQEAAAQEALIRGMSAKPWVNPDTGQTSTAPAGGLAGAQAALGRVEGPTARNLQQQLAMMGYEQEQATRAADLAFSRAKELRASPKWSDPNSPTNQAKYGNSLVWGTDAEGNSVLMQPSSAGGVRIAEMPEGVTPQRSGIVKTDLGDRIIWEDSTGRFIKEEMKQLGPSQTPEHAQNVASAGASGTQAVKASGEAFETLGKINTNIANIDDAIAAVDRGAETGPIYAMLPSIRTASIELDNIQNRMGLDIIGAVTFGALSKGELDLALNTALPTKLPPAELRAWLVSKKAAQQKLSKYLSEAAIYLGKPGNTVAMWADMRQPTTAATEPGTATTLKFDAQGNIIP